MEKPSTFFLWIFQPCLGTPDLPGVGMWLKVGKKTVNKLICKARDPCGFLKDVSFFLQRWTLPPYWAPEPMCESATTWRLVEPLVDSGYSVKI